MVEDQACVPAALLAFLFKIFAIKFFKIFSWLVFKVYAPSVDETCIMSGAWLSLGRDLGKLHKRVVNSDIYFEVILK